LAAKRFDFTPIPQPAAPARDLALTASSDGSQPLMAARLVPVDRLAGDPDQPRKVFDDEALAELAESLRTAGMRQPITAYYDDKLEQFVVVSGERRLLAARIAGLTQVPVLVERRPSSDADRLVLQLTENLVREDLTVPEAAQALARLKDLRPSDWLEVARRHGIGRRRAYQYLEHLKDAPPLQEALVRGEVSEGHAEELRRVATERLPELLNEVVRHHLSVADTRRLIAARRDEIDREEESPTESRQIQEGVAERGDQADDVYAGHVAMTMEGAEIPGSGRASGARLREARARRERSRRLRLRLERISAELRSVHLDEVTMDLSALPEIIVQARQARASLDRFIALLERIKLDQAGNMDSATP
jgi:ParB family chromosome partitioning protein